MTSSLPHQLASRPTDIELEALARDSALVLRDILDPSWIESMRGAIERALAEPSPMAREYTKPGDPGRYFGDFFLWLRSDEFRAFMADSPLPELAAGLMKSQRAFFFYDQLLVKEPGTAEETPLHHHLPYWPIRGQQVISIWVPFDVATPDLDRDLDPADHLAWPLAPGDVLIHHPLTLHFARGNASTETRRRGLALRYVGDDAVYDDRPGTFLESPQMRAALPDLALQDGDPFRGDLFPQVWPRSN